MLAIPSVLLCATACCWPPLLVCAHHSSLWLWRHCFFMRLAAVLCFSLLQVLDGFFTYICCFLLFVSSLFLVSRLLSFLLICVVAKPFCRSRSTKGVVLSRLGCQLATFHSVLRILLTRVSLLRSPWAFVPSTHRRHGAGVSCRFTLLRALTCYFSLVCPTLFVVGFDAPAKSRQCPPSVGASFRLGKTAAVCSFSRVPLRVETLYSLQLATIHSSVDNLWSNAHRFLTVSSPRGLPGSATAARHAAAPDKQAALYTFALLRSRSATRILLALPLSRDATVGRVRSSPSIPLLLERPSLFPKCITASAFCPKLFSTHDGHNVSALPASPPPPAGDNVSCLIVRRYDTDHLLPLRNCKHAENRAPPFASSACSEENVFPFNSSNYRNAKARQPVYAVLAVNLLLRLSLPAVCDLSVSVPCTNVTERNSVFMCRKRVMHCACISPVFRAFPCRTRTACFLSVVSCGRQCIAGSRSIPGRRWKQQAGRRNEGGRWVGLASEVNGRPGHVACTSRKEEMATGTTRMYASLLGRRRLKIHDAEKVHKVLRRGVPLRYLDVSGNVRPPTHVFNPVLVLRFAAVLDRFLFSWALPPLPAVEGGSLLRFLSKHARKRNGDPLSSYTAAAQQLRRIVSALLSTVHPVLRCMYTRWLRLQEQTGTPAHAAATAVTDHDRGGSSFSYSAGTTSLSSCSTSSPSAPSASPSPSTSNKSLETAGAYPRVPLPLELRQYRIIACAREAQSRSPSIGSSTPSGFLPEATTTAASPSGVDKCSERLALAIEGGAMRGCVTAGMAAALHHMGFADVFDAVYGSSAGSLVGAYFLSRQLPYEGAQIYYDWLPYMGRKFLDLKRLGKELGLGFLRRADLLGLFRNKVGNPLINLDVLLHDLVQGRQPLNWEKFRKQDQKQPLKVVASGLHTQKAVILESSAGHFGTFSSFLNCIRASMLMPGLAGPIVRVLVSLPSSSSDGSSNTSGSSTSNHHSTESSSSSSSSDFRTDSGGISISGATPFFPQTAAETVAVTASSAAGPSSSYSAVTADAATGSPSYSSADAAATPQKNVAAAAVAVVVPSSLRSCSYSVADRHPSPDAAAVAETASQASGSTADALFLPSSSCDSRPSSSSSSASSYPPPSPASFLSFPNSSSMSAGASVSEPLADALLFEPIPYRSALLQGYNRVLVLRSRPDGKRVGRLSGLEASIENSMASRFFGETQQLRRVYDYVKQRQHRIRYMDDLLLLNEASNNQKLLRVIKDQEKQQGGRKAEKCKQQQEAEERQQQEEQRPLEGYALAVSLSSSSAEVAKTTLKRKKILQGIRDGFARLYDVLVPDPSKRGRGMEEAFKVFPEDLPCVTDTLEAPLGKAASVAHPLPPPYDDSAEKQQWEAGVLGEYVLQAARAQDPRLIWTTSSILFASTSEAARLCEEGEAAAAPCPCSFSAPQPEKPTSA